MCCAVFRCRQRRPVAATPDEGTSLSRGDLSISSTNQLASLPENQGGNLRSTQNNSVLNAWHSGCNGSLRHRRTGNKLPVLFILSGGTNDAQIYHRKRNTRGESSHRKSCRRSRKNPAGFSGNWDRRSNGFRAMSPRTRFTVFTSRPMRRRSESMLSRADFQQTALPRSRRSSTRRQRNNFFPVAQAGG